MKRISLAALTGALAISTVAVAIEVASAAPRGGAYRGGVNAVMHSVNASTLTSPSPALRSTVKTSRRPGAPPHGAEA